MHADGSLVAAAGLFPDGSGLHPAKPGETIVLFGSGFGPTVPPTSAGVLISAPAALTPGAALEVTIDGIAASISFSGMTAAGLYQFNVVVPMVPDGSHHLAAQAGGVLTSQTVWLQTGQ